MTRKDKSGFTLIELMIVVAIIAIIAAIAIPGLLRARISSNEVSAIGTLKSLTTAQEQFKGQTIIDLDTTPDGTGEYGLFQELAGGTTGRLATAVAPTFMSVNFSIVSGAEEYTNKSGYFFLMFLPDAAGAPQDEATVNAGGAVPADANLQENTWVAYAWPADYGNSGNRAFVVNQEGTVYQNANATNSYDGSTTLPGGDGAFAVAADITGAIDVGGPGQKGDENWVLSGG